MTRFLLKSGCCGFVDVGCSLWREDGSVVYSCCWFLPARLFCGSESLGTCDHILLSQVRDFPFRRLPQLAGLRWRYSAPPPHGPDERHSFLPPFIPVSAVVVTSRLQFSTTEGCPDTFDQIVYCTVLGTGRNLLAPRWGKHKSLLIYLLPRERVYRAVFFWRSGVMLQY
jgi:hypothetical protein